MKERIFMCVSVLITTAKYSHTAGPSTSIISTAKPIPNKNSTSNAVTAAISEPVTTTRPPFLQGVRLPCSCLNGQCGCCTGVILERFRQKACLNITYDPDDFQFTAAMSLNGRVLYKNSISGKNPPPICIRLPRFRFIELCVEFSNIYFANRNMHVCIDMEANWESLTLLDFSFDCIRMGVNGVAVVGPAEGGGLPISPIDEEEQTDEDYDDSARKVPLFPNNIKDRKNRNQTLALTNSPYVNKTTLIKSKYTPPASSSKRKSLPRVQKLDSGDFLITFDDPVSLENEDYDEE